MRHRPLLLPLSSLVAGAIAAFWGYSPALWAICLVLLGAAIMMWFCSWRVSFLVVISLGCFLVANLQILDRLTPPPSCTNLLLQSGEAPIALTGIVEPRPEVNNGRSRLVVRVDQGANKSEIWRILVNVGSGDFPAMTGDQVRLVGRLKTPRRLELPGEFDRPRYLAWQGIYATTFLAQASDITVLAPGVDYPVRRWFDHLAQQLAGEIDRSVQNPARGLLKALLLGIRGDVSAPLAAEYAATGVNHILSVSGFHVGVIAVTLVALSTWLARWSQTLMLWVNVRRWSILAVLPLIYGYLLLTGMAPATVRSVLMLAAVCLTLVLEREHDYLDILILAAVGLLASAPWLLFDISCQLSFLALWGVIVLTPPFMAAAPVVVSPWGRRFIALLAASMAAILVTAPVVAYYFHLFSITGMVTNLIVVPLMGYGAVVIGFAGLLWASFAPVVAGLLFKVAGMLVDIANQGVHLLASAPVWRGVSPSAVDVLLCLAAILAGVGLPGKWRVPTITALLVCGVTCHTLTAKSVAGTMRVTFLSVGQAEATVVQFPDGTTMLIDAGGSPMREDSTWGERILVPALWRLGIRRLDYLVLTHPHDDHVGGAAYLLAAFPVGELWCGGGSDVQAWYALAAAAWRRQIPLRVVDGRTPALTVGGVQMQPLWPIPEGIDGDTNDRSLVMRLQWQGFSVLFAGDIGWEVADFLAQRYGAQLASTVLKIPHHGSRHSSAPALYQAVQPRHAVISAGYQNRFGLPAAETLAALHGARVDLLRTDLDGTIQIIAATEQQPLIMQRHFRQFN
jgi:competence protein ComEC